MKKEVKVSSVVMIILLAIVLVFCFASVESAKEDLQYEVEYLDAEIESCEAFEVGNTYEDYVAEEGTKIVKIVFSLKNPGNYRLRLPDYNQFYYYLQDYSGNCIDIELNRDTANFSGNESIIPAGCTAERIEYIQVPEDTKTVLFEATTRNGKEITTKYKLKIVSGNA